MSNQIEIHPIKVHINPTPEVAGNSSGIGRVVQAQYKYLPDFGIELVKDPLDADLIATHITSDGLPTAHVLHCHGLYWSADPDSGLYSSWHHNANARIAASARQARAITVPSPWVAEVFLRDMRLAPTVIGHGIDVDEWPPASRYGGYVLWNKNRGTDVCDPTPAWELATRRIRTVSTFLPRGKDAPDSMRVTGSLPHAEMKELVRHAFMYLMTTKETFGIGTLEAMAAGVPVLGYDWGGTHDIVEHKVTGYLVRPHDIAGLVEGYEYIKAHHAEMSEAAREYASKQTWPGVIGRYARLYRRTLEDMQTEKTGVTVVITNYNYQNYVTDAVDSILEQTYPVDEIVVVDDGSTDNSRATLKAYYDNNPRVTLLFQENQGVAAARNNGIRTGTQPFVICLDADDRLDKRYVETLRNAMLKNHALGVAYAGLALLGPEGQLNPNAWPPDFDWNIQTKPHVPPSNVIPCSAMFRRSMWERAGGYKQVYAPAEDTEFWVRGLATGFEAERITPEALFHYRAHSGSASRTKEYKPIDSWHPWMRDRQFPMAAPVTTPTKVRSYSEPAVSVIIPVGPGHEKYVVAALDSLLGQTCREWEVVIADDTKDGIPSEILRPYPFVRYVRTPGAPHGAGRARNLGVDKARAPLVLFLDADDYLLPSAIYDMLTEYVRLGGERYIYTSCYEMGADGILKLPDEENRIREYNAKAWLTKGQHAITALILRQNVLDAGGFDEEMAGWEDWEFFVKLATKGMWGSLLDKPLLVYRYHTGTRREDSLKTIQLDSGKPNLRDLIYNRYIEYREGVIPMPPTSCCGGGGENILAAKQALQGSVQDLPPTGLTQQPAVVKSGPPGEVIEPTRIRMEFVGPHDGPLSYNGIRESYYAGRLPEFRFHNVLLEDVEKLEGTGKFKKVARPLPSPPPAPAMAEPTVVETPKIEKVEELISIPFEPVHPVTAAEILRESGFDTEASAVERVGSVDKSVDKSVEPAEKEGETVEKPAKQRGRPRGSKSGSKKAAGKSVTPVTLSPDLPALLDDELAGMEE